MNDESLTAAIDLIGIFRTLAFLTLQQTRGDMPHGSYYHDRAITLYFSKKKLLFAIPGQSEIIGAPQNKKARVVRAKTEEKKCSLIL